MKPYANLAELIDLLQDDINALSDEIATLKMKPQNFNEKVVFKYIDTGSTGKVKDYVRSLGIKSERGSLYSSGDVSKLIKEGAPDISPKLLAIARKIMKQKKKHG